MTPKELETKWWHRFFQIVFIFIAAVIAIGGAVAGYNQLGNSYISADYIDIDSVFTEERGEYVAAHDNRMMQLLNDKSIEAALERLSLNAEMDDLMRDFAKKYENIGCVVDGEVKKAYSFSDSTCHRNSLIGYHYTAAHKTEKIGAAIQFAVIGVAVWGLIVWIGYYKSLMYIVYGKRT